MEEQGGDVGLAREIYVKGVSFKCISEGVLSVRECTCNIGLTHFFKWQFSKKKSKLTLSPQRACLEPFAKVVNQRALNPSLR